MLEQTAERGAPRGDEIPGGPPPDFVPREDSFASLARFIENVAPRGAPGVRMPWGASQLPWIGPGTEPLPKLMAFIEPSGILPADNVARYGFIAATRPNWSAVYGSHGKRAKASDRLYAALLHDLGRCSEGEIAEILGIASTSDRHTGPERSSTVRVLIAEGRALYRAAGMWPWAAVDAGPSWPASWWTDDGVLGALRAWVSRAWPVPPPAPPALVERGFHGVSVGCLADVFEQVELLERQALRLHRRAWIRARIVCTLEGVTSSDTIMVRAIAGDLGEGFARVFVGRIRGLSPRPLARNGSPIEGTAAVTVEVHRDDGQRCYYGQRSAPLSTYG